MIASKFSIGQQVRHNLLGYLGVVIDVDAVYALVEPAADKLVMSSVIRNSPWYHVVMQDNSGQPIQIYLSEAQLSGETQREHPEQPTLDELSASIRRQLQTPRRRN